MDAYSPFAFQEEIERLRENELGWMREAASTLLSKTHGAESSIVLHALPIDDPREKVASMADELKVAAVVVGSTGKGQLKRSLLGSTSTYLAHHCLQVRALERVNALITFAYPVDPSCNCDGVKFSAGSNCAGTAWSRHRYLCLGRIAALIPSAFLFSIAHEYFEQLKRGGALKKEG